MTELYKKHKRKIMLVAAVAIAVAVACITTGTYGIRYQSNDDATIANIAAGAYGSDRLHMVYVNVLFGVLLQPFYSMHPANWYVIVQLALATVSIAVISYTLMKKTGLLCGSIVTLAMVTAFAEPVYYTFQYTECSFIVLSAGLILIIDNLGRISKSTIAGIVLALLGTMIRWDVFYAVGGLSACLLVYKFFRLDIQGKKKAIVTMIMLFAVTFSAKAVDVMAYKTDPAWNEYNRYNAARTAYSDYKVYQLSGDNPFRQYGISDIDYTMLSYWNYYDGEKFTTELLEQISQGNQQISAGELAEDTIERIKYMMHGETYRYMFLLIVILSVVSLRLRWASVAMAGMYGIYGALMTYLVYRMRITSWVEMGLIWTVAVFALYCIAETGIKLPVNAVTMTAVLAAILYISLPVYRQLYIDYPNYVEWSKLEEPYMQAMSRDKENLYLLATQSISNVAGYDVLNPRGQDFFSNIVAYGGWLSRAPHRDAALAAYGLERPLVDAVDNPKVYLDYHYINEAVEYAKGQLGVEVYAVKTGSNAYAPYQLVTELP